MTLDLERLDPSSIGEMVADALAMADPPAALVDHLVHHSEGVPLYVAEYLGLAVAEGILARGPEGGWRLERHPSEVGSLPLPRSIQGIVSRRLEGLDAATRGLLEVAAVLGREIDEPDLEAAGGLDEAALADAVTRLVRQRLLEPGGPGGLRFVHDKIREVCYAGIGADRIAVLHRRAAEVLSSRGGSRPPLQEAIARHWERAGLPEPARACYLAAAREATAAFAHDRAAQLYGAYRRLATVPTEEGIQARLELSERVLLLGGRAAEAERELRLAVDEARGLGLRSAEGCGMLLLGKVLTMCGRADEARTCIEESLVIAGDGGDPRSEARALLGLARIDATYGRPQDGVQLARRALLRARESADRTLEGSALGDLALMMEGLGLMGEAREIHEQALAVHRETGNRRSEGTVVANLGAHLEARGLLEEARRAYEEALAIHREVGDRRFEGLVLSYLAALLRRTADIAGSDAYRTRALAIAREVGEPRLVGAVLADLGGRHRDAGRTDEARAAIEEALVIARRARDAHLEARLLGELAAILEVEERHEEARRLWEQALAIHQRSGDRMHEASALLSLSRHARFEGRMDDARSIHDRALLLAREVGDPRLEAAVLGQAAACALLVSEDGEITRELLSRAEALLADVREQRDLVTILCTRGHVLLAEEGSAASLLHRLRGLSRHVRASVRLGRDVARLERAQAAWNAGRTLVRGFDPADLSEGELRSIRDHLPGA